MVITIIAVLVGLLMVAIGRVRGRGDEVVVRADLTGLDTSLGQFKAKFGMNVPCSGGGPNRTFRLCSFYQTRVSGVPTFVPPFSANDPEIAALRQMFPRINLLDTGLRKDAQAVAPDANNDGDSDNLASLGYAPTSPATMMLLDPNQCLMFFLTGGMNMEYLGFATSPTQPFASPATATGGQRLTPFFDIKDRTRLRDPAVWLSERASDITALPAPPTGFTATTPIRWEASGTVPADNIATVKSEPWYLDPWKTPYLYMATSGFGSGGDYPYRDTPIAAPTPLLVGPWGGKVSGFNRTPALTMTSPPAPAMVFPNIGPVAYRESANKWVSHSSWQIVSGGPNGSDINNNAPWGFGLGFDRVTGSIVAFGKSTEYTPKDAGGDDFASFRSAVLSSTD